MQIIGLSQQLVIEDRVCPREAVTSSVSRPDSAGLQLPRHKPRHLSAGDTAHALKIRFHQALPLLGQRKIREASQDLLYPAVSLRLARALEPEFL